MSSKNFPEPKNGICIHLGQNWGVVSQGSLIALLVFLLALAVSVEVSLYLEVPFQKLLPHTKTEAEFNFGEKDNPKSEEEQAGHSRQLPSKKKGREKNGSSFSKAKPPQS
jgi:hypothetical protein